MRLTANLAVVITCSFVTATNADIRVPPKKEPVRITSNVTIKHGAIKGADRNVVAKIVIPASLVHAEAPRPGAAPTRNAPAPRSEEQGAIRGSTGTWVAGIALSLAAVSLVFVVRGKRTTRTIAATILGGSVLLGTYGAVYANAPAPPNRADRAPASQIVIELVEEGDSVTLLLAEQVPMATVAAELDPRAVGAIPATRTAWLFAGAAAAMIAFSCALAGFAPLGFSIATVFLFAGPHNWLEARYMLTRMPGRWGSLAPYFITGISGVLLLTGAFALLPILGSGLNAGGWNNLLATWNTLLIGWIVTLALLRSRQNPRRDWTWLVPLALTLVALNWLWPFALSLALVYLHPLMALWFLDREIGRMQPAWRSAYRGCLLLIPVCLGLLWWNLAAAPNLPGDDVLTWQITNHAGGGMLKGVSTHLLVSTHVFLEMLHYGVWIVAIPLVSVRMVPWKLDNVPLARRSTFWRACVIGAVAMGVVVMLVLWGAFLADYPLTRNVYFTVAMLHVLAEVPFLLRLL